jgi:molybdenum cofactor guanylyltransferase
LRPTLYTPLPVVGSADLLNPLWPGAIEIFAMKPSHVELAPVAGVILAGGRSSRMQADKAFAPLAGRPLIAHVLARLRPQVDFVIINANGGAARFDGMGALVVADADPSGFAGPLAGLSAAMALARANGVAVLASAPCDAPFLPDDLVERLRRGLEETGAPAAVAGYAGELEPMFCLWRASMQAPIDAALAQGEASPRKLLARCGAAVVAFNDDRPGNPFENINDAQALAAAENRLARRRA